jgi:hypothetical protein
MISRLNEIDDQADVSGGVCDVVRLRLMKSS